MRPLLLALASLSLVACAVLEEPPVEVVVDHGPGAGRAGASGAAGASSTATPGGASGSSGAAGSAGGLAGTAGQATGPGGVSGADGGASAAGAGGSGNGGQPDGGQGGAAGQPGEGAGGQAAQAGQAGQGTGAQAGDSGKSGAAGTGSGAAGAPAAGTGGAGVGGSGGGGSGGAGSGGSGAAGAAGAAGAGAGGAAAGAGGASGGVCPPEMAFVDDGALCVDRWEARVEVDDGLGWAPHSPYETLGQISGQTRAVSEPGVVPQGYISGEQAQEACLGAGKRLCTIDEYRAACQGPGQTVYPYGNTYEHGVCNEGRAEHPVIELFPGGGPEIWDSTHMNDPLINQQADTLALTGERAGCESGYGAFDMVGNLHEWVADPAGTFCGGFYVDAEINGKGCLYKTTAHAFTYHDYSTGFRCCLTP
jgi:formylglycine-generating enzyme